MTRHCPPDLLDGRLAALGDRSEGKAEDGRA